MSLREITKWVRHRVVRWLACVAIIVSCWFDASAQAQYRFDSWTEESGLPLNWIKGICQTRDGYLWLTTAQGAARFDGVRFKIFNRANTPAFNSDRFSLYAVFEDHAGNLWMGTEDGGVVKYRDGVFNSLTSADGLPGDAVVRIDEDSDGAVWFFTTKGLARWKDGRLTNVIPEPGSTSPDFLLSPPGAGEAGKYFGLWRRDADGWQRFAHGEWSSFPLPPQVKDPARLRFGAVEEDWRGRVWYSLEGRPEERYMVADGHLTTLRGFDASQQVHYEDSQGRLWLTDQKGGLALLVNGRLTPLSDSAPPNFTRVFEDHEGTIWVGSLNRGLFRLKRQVATVYLHPGVPQYNNIQPLMQDRAGNVWVGSGGLARLVAGRFENIYQAGQSHSPFFESNILISLFEDGDGSFWLGVRDGIVRFRGGRLERDEELSSQIKGWVHAILRDGAGDLWFASEQGLYRLREGSLTRYGKQDGLASDDVRVLHEDRTGTLWIGTVAGLSRLTKSGFYTLGQADGVSSGRVSALYEDAGGVLWVGTYDGVLYRLTSDAGKTRAFRYTPAQGLPPDAIHTILEDDDGFFWFGGQHGIYRLSRQGLDDITVGRATSVSVTRLGKEDGLLSPSCNSWGQPAGFKSRDGRLWFPTEEGVAVINPQDLHFNQTPPPVRIEECLLDRQPVATDSNLRISPRQENLEINYTALSFIKPEQIRFRYQLEGLDEDWVDAGTRRTAYYSHLPPGEYTFRVIADNGEGVWNTTGQSLRVVVLPPFYRTWWFVSLVAIGIAAVVLAAWKFRVAQLERARAAQQAFSRQLIESQEQERKRIAAELHDSLGQTLLVIKNRAFLGTRPNGGGDGSDARLEVATEQLEEISDSASEAINQVREIAYHLRPSQLERLGLTAALEEMVEQVAASSSIKFDAEVAELDGVFSKESEINFYRIAQESLNNVVKHSGASAVKFLVRREGRGVELTVQDNGRGFEPGAHAASRQPGFGLTGVAERARILGGRHSIESAVGRGTTLTVRVEEAKG